MKRILSSWQGWAGAVVAAVIYFALPGILRRSLDPTAGEFPPAFNAGFLQLFGLAAMVYFLSAAIIWAWWQIAFRSLDRLYDGRIDDLNKRLPPWLAVLMIQGSFVFAAAGWAWALGVAFRLIG